jgi:hypothetical protein
MSTSFSGSPGANHKVSLDYFTNINVTLSASDEAGGYETVTFPIPKKLADLIENRLSSIDHFKIDGDPNFYRGFLIEELDWKPAA